MATSSAKVKSERSTPSRETTASPRSLPEKPKTKSRGTKSGGTTDSSSDNNKRRCVSTACIACRRRKSKCDGNLPACAACSSVYGTECVYDPNSDHRRKGVYKKDIDNLRTRNSTLQTLVQAILNYPDNEVADLVRQIRTTDSLDDVAESIVARENDGDGDTGETDETLSRSNPDEDGDSPKFESHLASKIGELRLGDGSVHYLGGTSNLLYLEQGVGAHSSEPRRELYQQHENPVTSWTNVTSDPDLIMHLLNMYFTWHYTFFTTLPKHLFWRDFSLGRPPDGTKRRAEYCTELLVNVMLCLGCHFTAHPGARANPDDSSTAGDHFFVEAKRIILDDGILEKPKLGSVQALGLMSVREAGCGRENGGWAYSGMSFRMANDIGLSYMTEGLKPDKKTNADEEEDDARRITFWGGSFLIDKCWSNYLGRLPLFETSQNITMPKFEVFPVEDADTWKPYTDSGFMQAHAQPARTRAVSLQMASLCEISGDIMREFYHPQKIDRLDKQTEINRLSEIHTRLETWRRNLPSEFEPKEGGLSSVLVMHMYFQLLYIHLFRPFLKYNQTTSPLPANVSPRKLCTQAAGTISKLLRLYKRSHGLRQIVNIAVYIAHTACTVHLLNLPEKNAKRDITHGVKNLEEIAEGWICARRTLCVLSSQVRNWGIELPDEAATVLARTDAKYGDQYMKSLSGQSTPHYSRQASPSSPNPAVVARSQMPDQWLWQQQDYIGASATNIPDLSKTAAAVPSGQMPNTNGNGQHMQQVGQFANPIYDIQMDVGQGQQTFASNIATNIPSEAPAQGMHQDLLRGPDWWFKDQTQIAHGFGNWNMVDTDQQQQQQQQQRQASWAAGQATVARSRNSQMSGSISGTHPLAMPNGTSMNNNGVAGGYANGIGSYQGDVTTDGFAVIANNYNENDWYS